MSIADYNALVTSIKKWCARSDTTFSAQIETFVQFAEMRMNNGEGQPGDELYCPYLAAPELEGSSIVSPLSGVWPIPTEASTLRVVRRANDDAGLAFMSPRQFSIEAARQLTGNPIYYTVEERALKVAPVYVGDLEMTYFKNVVPLGPTNLTNVVLTNYPLLYLSGCLFEAFAFMQEMDLARAQYARYKSQVAGINTNSNSIRFGGGPLRIRPRNPIP